MSSRETAQGWEKMMGRRLTISALAVLVAFIALGNERKRSQTTYVRDAIMPYVESGELPGAISVLERDGMCEVACLGYADVARKRRITMDDVFMQCSQTKGFCGVTVAKLDDAGADAYTGRSH